MGKHSMNHSSNLNDGYDWGCLQSITEQNQLDEFMLMAEKTATEYAAEKMNIVFINPTDHGIVPTRDEEDTILDLHEQYQGGLQIPRRPYWDESTSPEELKEKEKEAFLEWRRSLAEIEAVNGLVLTPFEKNLEFWCQLWRVVEKSEIVVQVLDARNPLLFRCEDLEKYVKEVDEEKINMLLLNKADLLTAEQRKIWKRYFDEVGITSVFYSAKPADQPSAVENEEDEHVDGNADDDCLGKILSRQEILEFIRSFKDSHFPTKDVITFGMVGYPNVGKSSTINTLLDAKKVSVSATPGKTKHFQTLFLESDVCLCDCPGLVMPSFAVSKADLLLNGILPIDQMVDHVPAVNLVLSRVPCHVLEKNYGIRFSREADSESSDFTPTVEQFLNAYGYMRGFMTQRGLPDNSRSSRYILKDYVQGKLLFCHAPPDVTQETFHPYPSCPQRETLPTFTPQQIKINKDKLTVKELDAAFSKQVTVQAHGKGIRLEGGLTKRIDPSASDNSAKPWKKQKKPKKEKLRRAFSHLDQ